MNNYNHFPFLEIEAESAWRRRMKARKVNNLLASLCFGLLGGCLLGYYLASLL